MSGTDRGLPVYEDRDWNPARARRRAWHHWVLRLSVCVCEGGTLVKAPSCRGRFSPQSCPADRSLVHILTKLIRLETGQSADLSERDCCQGAPT